MEKLIRTLVPATLMIFIILGILALTKAEPDGVPAGTIVSWAGEDDSIPAGWLLCNGHLLNKKQYKDLFDAIGYSWGGSGKNFNLPDLRGRFIRGVDPGTGRDPDAKKRSASYKGGNRVGVGSVQDDALQQHSHRSSPHSHQDRYHTFYISGNLVSGSTSILMNTITLGDTNSTVVSNLGVCKYDTKASVKYSEESRPTNVAVNFIIKVK